MHKYLRDSLAAPMSIATLAFATASAHAMTVQPIILDLQPAGHGMTQAITVTNTAASPLPVELNAHQLLLSDGVAKADGQSSSDLAIYPPQAVIQPGQTQTFRIQYVGDPALGLSKHYYVTVAQLPVKLPGLHPMIQVLYNFQVLTSVGPRGLKPALRVASAQVGRNATGQPAPVVTLSNDSAEYGYISSGMLRVVEKDATGRVVFRRILHGPEIRQTLGYGLISGHQTRRVTLPIVLPVEGGGLEAEFVSEVGR